MISSFRISIGNIFMSSKCWSSMYGKGSLQKQARQLQRMLDKAASKRKKQAPPKLLEKGLLPSAYDNTGFSRRVLVMNKVYMEQITMLLNSGKYGSLFTDLGIEISKVSMGSALNSLNIYWIPRRDDVPEKVLNDALLGALSELQEQMGGIRYTSKVPFLKFVKDLRLEREMKLDKIFESADFGKDFNPIYGKKVFTSDFVKEAEKVPEMRQNVLGLDHAKIKSRLAAEIKKFKAIDTTPRDTEPERFEPELPQKIIEFNKKEFIKFYKRKRILNLKIRKKMKQSEGSLFDDIEYVVEEGYTRNRINLFRKMMNEHLGEAVDIDEYKDEGEVDEDEVEDDEGEVDEDEVEDDEGEVDEDEDGNQFPR